MLGDGTDDFSFSGLKTSVLYRCMGQNVKASRANLKPGIRVEDVAASFQQAVVDVLIGKTLVAARREGARSVLAGGGVTANRALREALERACAKEGLDLRLPGPGLSTDNAAMVAAAAHPRLVAGERDDLDLDAHARMR
jgi:N6-L-threonylcarbamoyladenine synthase